MPLCLICGSNVWYRSDVWYGYGTFRVAPKHFYQLNNIPRFVMDQGLPLAYCILTKKNLEMFSVTKNQAEKRDLRVSVSKFRGDFEDACYINDLPDALDGLAKIFADNTKVYRAIELADRAELLQNDVGKSEYWGCEWKMSYSTDKCHHAHICENTE